MNISEPPARQPEAAADLWEVAAALPIFHTLTYRLPEALQKKARVGCLARVPAKRRLVTGYLLGPAREMPEAALRPIQAILDPLPRFGPEMVPLFRWLADYYQYPLGEALDHLIPGGAGSPGLRTERWAAWQPLPEGTEPPRRLSPRAQGLIQHLQENGPTSLKELNRLFTRCAPVIKRLTLKGLIALEDRDAWRDPLEGQDPAPAETALKLSADQEVARAAVVAGISSREFSPFLLHGVTASGKTEVYLAAAQATLDQGRQVLVLLPEIALTHPVALAFRRRFGSRVALLHSGMSASARLEQWRRITLGQLDIAVGARSAIFAPLPRLGLVVVDEEHDPAYKQEGGLLYQARDVALYRGKLAAATVVLVSATPAVTSYYRAQEGKYRYLNLSRRVTPQALPDIHLISLKEHRSGPGLPVISRPLALSLEETLARGEQALLFLNRRGYATVLFCLFCGEVIQCYQCSVALTYHQAKNALICHYCGYEEPVPLRCPQCQSTALKRYGLGTERVEAEIHKIFPQARVARLDRDTAPHSGRALKVLEEFARGRTDILVGTQMISKGHHFPGVTLVGVIAADRHLFFPEYHAGERTFQLLSQVAGRAGRGEAPGKVLIQTFHPDHFVFQAIKSQDYQGFVQQELESRRESGYPPFTRLALARLSGLPAEAVAQAATRLTAALKKAIAREEDLAPLIRVLGPAPPGLTRLKGRFRWQLLLKSYGRPPLHRALEMLRRLWTPPPKSKIDLTLDIDPMSLF
ncbi:MAG: replication restart helicase PriA [Thermodesulfobacteriota bacterium]